MQNFVVEYMNRNLSALLTDLFFCRRNRTFRVFLVLPLIPFVQPTKISEMGEGDAHGFLCPLQVFFSRVPRYLSERLQDTLGRSDISEFISICGLRSIRPVMVNVGFLPDTSNYYLLTLRSRIYPVLHIVCELLFGLFLILNKCLTSSSKRLHADSQSNTQKYMSLPSFIYLLQVFPSIFIICLSVFDTTTC